MRKSILLPLFFLPLLLSAQHEFAPVGAKWYYEHYDWFPPYYKIVALEVTGIDTIQGRACKRIENHHDWACSDCYDILHVYEENGKVYRLIDSTFYLFLDFTAQAGESWLMETAPVEPNDSMVVQVDSISWTYLPNGDSLQVQHVSFPNFGMPGGTIMEWGYQNTERLGNDYFMCPQSGVCDPHIGVLRCYRDPEFEIPAACEAQLDAQEPNGLLRKGLLFPNPAGGFVTLSADFEADEVVLSSMWGGMRATYFLNKEKQLSLDGVESGLYVAVFFQKGKLVGIDKLVVMRG